MFTYSVAANGARERARKLIHQVFVEELGFGGVGPDSFDSEATFLSAHFGEEVVAALRIVPDSPRGLPLDQFVDLASVRIQGGAVAEVSRLACLPAYRSKGVIEKAVPFFIGVLQEMNMRHVVIESLLSTVGFYQRIGFAPFGPPFVDHSVVDANGDLSPNALAMHLRI